MLYEILLKRKRKKDFSKTDEYLFYMKHASTFASVLSYYHFTTNEKKPFRVIQANIIIKALINKGLFEANLDSFSLEATQEVKVKQDAYIKDKIWSLLDSQKLPYFNVGKTRIYIPVFSRSLNLIYNEECSKVLDYPYSNLLQNPHSSCVDLFDVYNYELYDSPFSSLIKIKEDKTSCAFYHPDFETIYIINNQGRLDVEISLFDKYLSNKEQHHIFNKIENVVECFYKTDIKKFIRSLLDNGFISKKTYYHLNYKLSRTLIRRDNLFNKGNEDNEVL